MFKLLVGFFQNPGVGFLFFAKGADRPGAAQAPAVRGGNWSSSCPPEFPGLSERVSVRKTCSWIAKFLLFQSLLRSVFGVLSGKKRKRKRSSLAIQVGFWWQSSPLGLEHTSTGTPAPFFSTPCESDAADAASAVRGSRLEEQFAAQLQLLRELKTPQAAARGPRSGAALGALGAFLALGCEVRSLSHKVPGWLRAAFRRVLEGGGD